MMARRAPRPRPIAAPSLVLSRRGLLRTGGTTISLGALIAACSSEAGAPGRVGNAPVVTDLPQAEINDAVLLRTATSLEYSALDLYQRAIDLDALDDAAMQYVQRFVEDHTRHADAMVDLTTQAGGEPYECANQWMDRRVLDPLFQHITGDEAADIPPSDDAARDLLGLSYAFESMIGAMYQKFVEQVSTPELRQQVVTHGAEEVRHAAAVAILRDGAPEAYINPTVYGGEVDLTKTDGVIPLYAITGSFGSLAPIELTLGPKTEAGTRFTTTLQTPAENSYVYDYESCDV
jgi:hypothetical protein